VGAALAQTTPHCITADESGLASRQTDVSDGVRRFVSSIMGLEAEDRRGAARKAIDSAAPSSDAPPGESDVGSLMIRIAALGAIARSLSFDESVEGRYGSQSKEALAQLTALAPSHPWTLALQGLWNLEVVRRAGFLSIFTSASAEKGRQLLTQAVVVGCNDAAIPFAYAVALVSSGDPGDAAEVESLLRESLRRSQRAPDDPVAETVAKHAAELMAHMEQNDREAAMRLSLRLL